MTTIRWQKMPSVTPGGKPFFWRGLLPDNQVVLLVWDRVWCAYQACFNDACIGHYYPTVTAGKRAVQRHVDAEDAA